MKIRRSIARPVFACAFVTLSLGPVVCVVPGQPSAKTPKDARETSEARAASERAWVMSGAEVTTNSAGCQVESTPASVEGKNPGISAALGLRPRPRGGYSPLDPNQGEALDH